MAVQPKDLKPAFPVWEFLNQPLFDPAHPFIWNPRKFHHHRNVQLLKRCWLRTCQSEGHHMS